MSHWLLVVVLLTTLADAQTVTVPLFCYGCQPSVVSSQALSIISAYFGIPSGQSGVSITALDAQDSSFMATFGFASAYTSLASRVLPEVNAIFPYSDTQVCFDTGYYNENDAVAQLDYDAALGSPALLYVFDLNDYNNPGVICSPNFTNYDALSLCRSAAGKMYDLKDVSFTRTPSSTLPVRLRTSPGCNAFDLLAIDCPAMSTLIPLASATTTCTQGAINLLCEVSIAPTTVNPLGTTTTTSPTNIKAQLSNHSHRSGIVTLNDGVYQGAICIGRDSADGFAAQTLCSMAGLATSVARVYGTVAPTPGPTYTIGGLFCESVQTSVTGCSKETVTSCSTGLLASAYCPEVTEGGAPRPFVTLFTLAGQGAETLSGVLGTFVGEPYTSQVVITSTENGMVSFYNVNPSSDKFGPSGADLDYVWSTMSTEYIRLVLSGTGAITRTFSTYSPTTTTTMSPFPPGIPTQPPNNNAPVAQNTDGWTYRLKPFYANNPNKGFFEILPKTGGVEYMCTPVNSSDSSNIALSQGDAMALCNILGKPYSNAKAFTAPMMLPVVGISDASLPTITSLTCEPGAFSMDFCEFYRNSTVGSIRCGGTMKIALQCGPDVAVELTAITSKAVAYNEASFKEIISDQSLVSPSRIQLLGISGDSSYAYRRFTITDPTYMYESPSTNYPSFSFPSGSPSDFSMPSSAAGIQELPQEVATAVDPMAARGFDAEALAAYNQTGSGSDMTNAFISTGSFEALAIVGIHEMRSNLSRYSQASQASISGFGLTRARTFFDGITSSVFGRVEVSVAGNPPGAADSTGVTDATAVSLCAQMGITNGFARVIPHVATPDLTTPIYVRGLSCSTPMSCSFDFSDPLAKSGNSIHMNDIGLLCARNVLPAIAFTYTSEVLLVSTNGTRTDGIIPCLASLLNVPSGRFSIVASATLMAYVSVTESETDLTAQDVYVVAMLTNTWACYSMCGIISLEKSSRPTTSTSGSTPTQTTSTQALTTLPTGSTQTLTTLTTGPTQTLTTLTTGSTQTLTTLTTGSTQTQTSQASTAASASPANTTASTSDPQRTETTAVTATSSATSTIPTSTTGRATTTTIKTTSTTPTIVTTTQAPNTIVEFKTNATNINTTAMRDAIAKLAGTNVSGVTVVTCPNGGSGGVCFEFKDKAAALRASDAANDGLLKDVGISGAAAANEPTSPPSSDDDDNTTTIIIIVVVVVVVLLIVGAITVFMCKKSRANKSDEPDANENFVQLLELENAEGDEGSGYAI